MADEAPLSVADQRRTIILGMAVAAPAAVATWLATYRLLPREVAERAALHPLAFAFGCLAVAVLLCFVTGVEAIAHRRLFSAAIDPLAGADPPELEVDRHYLQQTLEQLVPFAAGLFGLALYATPAAAVRAIAATGLVWIVSRFVYWIGYRRAPRFRAPGLVGMTQSLLVLLWVVWRFGSEVAGPVAGAAPIVLFLLIEAILLIQAKR